MNGEAPRRSARLARSLWLAYTILTILGAFAVLAIYVNIYDDYDVSERLRAAGVFLRRAMNLLSFPLGWAAGGLTKAPLARAFGCEAPDAPCSIFIDWQTRFVALLAQIALLRWMIARRF